jgi:hypothetical protein
MSRREWSSDDWERCGPPPLPETKVFIIEALRWIDQPLSARIIQLIMDGSASVALIAYHLRQLGALSVVEHVGDKVVRGAVQRFYRLSF